MSRSAGGLATLGEIMGSKAKEVSLRALPEILGEKMPELPRDGVGRLRLMKALRNRFGEGFKNIPGVKGMLKEFDSEVNLKRIIALNRRDR